MRQRAAAWSLCHGAHQPPTRASPPALIPAQALPPFVPPLQKAKDLLGGLFNQKGDK